MMIEATVLRPHEGRRWGALHTRARHEKKVISVCEGLQIPGYLPLRVHHTFSGGKVNTFMLPMFPGYLFAALAPGDITHLKRTGSVAQRIEAADEPALLRDLGNVLGVERAGVEAIEARRLEVGQTVMVMRGPLAGVTGIVVRYKNRTRLQVSVGAIGQGVLIDVAEDAVMPVTEGEVLLRP